MIDTNHIVENYLAAWNETDTDTRRVRIAALFSENASYLDPMMRGEGHAGLEQMIGAVQRQFDGYRFAACGTVDTHNEVVRFSWSLGLPTQAPVAYGTDVAEVAADGRLQRVIGFLDAAPAAV
ncbi:nuclear transport factor 2 family protein [Pseudolysobacter antarcticus]|uniref:Nuclear transport factor 2 family protein n=1 Tax=Pseudolysobacter antarcticus TaxID=2511995 RepID=A0A411HLV5_9GAMM|nr:nuclear transport factor 2 family protein [Pseudolysobacter antarcticus]QBB71506.1 nuclear transport factor 2 family protein [Pseudolysobacter antarcticus]